MSALAFAQRIEKRARNLHIENGAERRRKMRDDAMLVCQQKERIEIGDAGGQPRNPARIAR
jgi:hypothetical protein